MTTYNAGVCRFCFMQCYECSSVCTPYFTSPPMTAHHISVFVCTPESCISPFCVDLQPPLPAYLISVSVCTLKCLYVPSVCLFAMLNTAYIVLYLSVLYPPPPPPYAKSSYARAPHRPRGPRAARTAKPRSRP